MEVEEKSKRGGYVRLKKRIRRIFLVEIFTIDKIIRKARETKTELAITIEYVFHPNIFPNKAYMDTVPKPCVPNEKQSGTVSLIV
jgi:hypothetical protein